MSQIADFKEYLKYKPEYKEWKNERDIQNEKKNEYLKNNSIPQDELNKDIERAKERI